MNPTFRYRLRPLLPCPPNSAARALRVALDRSWRRLISSGRHQCPEISLVTQDLQASKMLNCRTVQTDLLMNLRAPQSDGVCLRAILRLWFGNLEFGGSDRVKSVAFPFPRRGFSTAFSCERRTTISLSESLEYPSQLLFRSRPLHLSTIRMMNPAVLAMCFLQGGI